MTLTYLIDCINLPQHLRYQMTLKTKLGIGGQIHIHMYTTLCLYIYIYILLRDRLSYICNHFPVLIEYAARNFLLLLLLL